MSNNAGVDLKSVTLARWGSSVLLPTWYLADAWYAGVDNVLHPTAVSGLAGVGYSASTTDSASGAYLAARDHSQIVYLASGGAVTSYAGTSGVTYTGAAYAGGHPYFVDGAGQLSTLVGSTVTALASGFSGSPPTQTLAASGSTLYTMFTGPPLVGTFALATQTTGASGALPAPPFSSLNALAVSGAVAVAGVNFSTYATGFAAIAMEPGTGGLLLGVNTSSGTLTAFANAGSGIWAQSQSVSGLGAPIDIAWSPNDQFAFSSDPTAGQLHIFSNTFGTLASSQTIPIVKATQTAILSDSLHGLVAQGANNSLTALLYSGVTWSSGVGIASIANPVSVIGVSANTAVVGYASGVAYLAFAAGTWSVSGTVALPYQPVQMTADAQGNIYAVGTAGGSGYLSVLTGATVVASGYWAGSGNAVYVQQGQVLVADTAASLIRVFGVAAGVLTAQPASSTTFTSPVAIAGIGAYDIFVAGPSYMRQYNFVAPFTVARQTIGGVSIYNGSSWQTATLGASGTPMALAWSGSTLYCATLQNNLYTLSSSGAVTSVVSIAQPAPQSQSVPVGISSMLWVGAALWGSTILDDRLVRII